MAFPLPLLHQREIEARAIAPFYRAVAAEAGETRARELLAAAIRGVARDAGAATAEAAGGNGLVQLKEMVASWCEDGALEIAVRRDDADAYEFDVTRCCYAEMYRRLGLAELGPILSCGRDAAAIDGFNPAIAFSRTQTLMEGAACCDFRYRLPNAPLRSRLG